MYTKAGMLSATGAMVRIVELIEKAPAGGIFHDAEIANGKLTDPFGAAFTMKTRDGAAFVVSVERIN